MLVSLLNNEIDEKEYLREYNATVIYRWLPKKIYGFVFKYRDMCIIIINRSLSEENKKKTLLHEFAHIELGHLDKELLEFSIENVEDDADRYIKSLVNETC